MDLHESEKNCIFTAFYNPLNHVKSNFFGKDSY